MTTSQSNRQLGFKTRSIHIGYDPLTEHGAVVPPIYMTSTYAFPGYATSEDVASGESEAYVYGREHNPTQSLLEARIANLEGAEACVVTASGMAAISSLFLSLLAPGDEVIVHRTLYSNTIALISEGMPRLGIRIIPVDLAQPESVKVAISAKTKMVYFETPVNPTAEVLDIAAIVKEIGNHSIKVVVDSTFASPAVQRPIEFGADIVIHSLTKYINGHGDILGGAVVGDTGTIMRVRGIGLRYMTGATLSPMACFLVLRGLKTLKIRMGAHSETALVIAEMLDNHPAIRHVRYPFLGTNPDVAIARRQMISGSAMISFELKAGYEGAVAMMSRLQLISRAVSLGDVESLIMHPGSLVRAHRKVQPDAKLTAGVSSDLIRLSVGLEDAEDLLLDLHQALEGL